MARALTACVFKVGDTVAFKKPKRNPTYAVVEHIESDWSKTTWSNGGTVPNFVTVELTSKIMNGSNRVKTHAKRLRLSVRGTT